MVMLTDGLMHRRAFPSPGLGANPSEGLKDGG